MDHSDPALVALIPSFGCLLCIAGPEDCGFFWRLLCMVGPEVCGFCVAHGLLGACWGCVGALLLLLPALGHFWATPSRSWVALARSWAALGYSLAALGPPLVYLSINPFIS